MARKQSQTAGLPELERWDFPVPVHALEFQRASAPITLLKYQMDAGFRQTSSGVGKVVMNYDIMIFVRKGQYKPSLWGSDLRSPCPPRGWLTVVDVVIGCHYFCRVLAENFVGHAGRFSVQDKALCLADVVRSSRGTAWVVQQICLANSSIGPRGHKHAA